MLFSPAPIYFQDTYNTCHHPSARHGACQHNKTKVTLNHHTTHWKLKIDSQPIRCLEASDLTNQWWGKVLTLESSGQRRVQHGDWGEHWAVSTCGASLAPNVTSLGPTASHSSGRIYSQIKRSVSSRESCFDVMICGQCLKCQELDPEAVRGPGMWPHLIRVTIKSIKRIWKINSCYFLAALSPEYGMEASVDQFLYLCVLYFGSADVWACNTTFRAPCKALGLDMETRRGLKSSLVVKVL